MGDLEPPSFFRPTDGRAGGPEDWRMHPHMLMAADRSFSSYLTLISLKRKGCHEGIECGRRRDRLPLGRPSQGQTAQPSAAIKSVFPDAQRINSRLWPVYPDVHQDDAPVKSFLGLRERSAVAARESLDHDQLARSGNRSRTRSGKNLTGASAC